MAGEPAGFVIGRGSEVGVDGDFDEIGTEDVGDGFEENGQRGGGGGELVGLEVADEAAHEAAVVGLADYVVVDARALGRVDFLFLLFGHWFYFRGFERGGGFRRA